MMNDYVLPLSPAVHGELRQAARARLNLANPSVDAARSTGPQAGPPASQHCLRPLIHPNE